MEVPGNEQLTAIVATLLLVLLAIEGATLLNLESLLTMHAFVGMLLIPVVALKVASTGWRMLRYYLGGEEYVRRGPPFMWPCGCLSRRRSSVSTLVLFSTGVALLALNRTQGAIVGLHKASFVVWFGAASLHVITRIFRLLPILRQWLPGTVGRLGLGRSIAGGRPAACDDDPARRRPAAGCRLGFGRHRRALGSSVSTDETVL